ncbi:MAG: hypothetical protein LCH79_20625 [Proteobacteria bacterium]|nr:hypothetical protein [Pseudomonadota bacterium]
MRAPAAEPAFTSHSQAADLAQLRLFLLDGWSRAIHLQAALAGAVPCLDLTISRRLLQDIDLPRLEALSHELRRMQIPHGVSYVTAGTPEPRCHVLRVRF